MKFEADAKRGISARNRFSEVHKRANGANWTNRLGVVRGDAPRQLLQLLRTANLKFGG